MGAFKAIENKIISINLAKKIVGLVFVAFLFDFFFFAAPVLASENDNNDIYSPEYYNDTINPDDDILFLEEDEANESGLEEEIITETEVDYNGINKFLPKNEIKKPALVKPKPAIAKPIGTRKVLMTAYNSEKAQTDDSPCITATGFNVCQHGKEDTIAANFLKFGTKVKIPELFGDRVFVVRDRMNKRYTYKIDIWMTERSKALQFGVKYAKIEIVP